MKNRTLNTAAIIAATIIAMMIIILAGTGCTPAPAPLPTAAPTVTPDWLDWESRPIEDWPATIDGRPVCYVYVGAATSPLVYKDQHNVYTIYENADWGTTHPSRRIIAKAGRWVMAWPKGDNWSTDHDDCRPYTGDGGSLAYRVMYEQTIDGHAIWSFDHPLLYIKYNDITAVFAP